MGIHGRYRNHRIERRRHVRCGGAHRLDRDFPVGGAERTRKRPEFTIDLQ